MKIKLDKQSLNAATKRELRRRLNTVGDAVGQTVVSQMQGRFANGGDEEITWEPLWVNNTEAVKSVTDRQGGAEKLADDLEKAEKRLANAEKKLNRIIGRSTNSGGSDAESDAEDKAAAALVRARKNLEEKQSAKLRGTSPLFRAGGKPLRDTGDLFSSINFARSVDGDKLTVRWGSNRVYAPVHNYGAKKKGKSYIPLTQKARKGWNPNLIQGYDYIILSNVKIPARPFLRMTDNNRQEIRTAITDAVKG